MCKNRSGEQTSELTVVFMRGDMDLILTDYMFMSFSVRPQRIKYNKTGNQGRQGCFHFFWLGLLIIGHYAELKS